MSKPRPHAVSIIQLQFQTPQDSGENRHMRCPSGVAPRPTPSWRPHESQFPGCGTPPSAFTNLPQAASSKRSYRQTTTACTSCFRQSNLQGIETARRCSFSSQTLRPHTPRSSTRGRQYSRPQCSCISGFWPSWGLTLGEIAARFIACLPCSLLRGRTPSLPHLASSFLNACSHGPFHPVSPGRLCSGVVFWAPPLLQAGLMQLHVGSSRALSYLTFKYVCQEICESPCR